MIALDEDALICDMAETYHIYNMEQLPVEYANHLNLVTDYLHLRVHLLIHAILLIDLENQEI
jgi:hypothetical protein